MGPIPPSLFSYPILLPSGCECICETDNLLCDQWGRKATIECLSSSLLSGWDSPSNKKTALLLPALKPSSSVSARQNRAPGFNRCSHCSQWIHNATEAFKIMCFFAACYYNHVTIRHTKKESKWSNLSGVFAPAFASWYSRGTVLRSNYDTISRGIKTVNMNCLLDFKYTIHKAKPERWIIIKHPSPCQSGPD